MFLPNPVAELQNESLTDQKDADYAALQPAYHNVTLTNLDGSGTLTGDWAQVVSETGDPARSSTNTFTYHRNDDRFEQVMAYYWITEAQKYIQSLGFGTGTYPPVNMQSQRVRINQWGLDNSFATDHPKDELRFGKGGVDDAEDAEVILHEYGHAIHFSQNFSFASEEAGAISEGFGDYWAADVSNIVAPTPDPACVADWDSVSYTSTAPHCLRRVDTEPALPERPERRGAPRRADLVAGAVGHPRRARPRQGRHDHPERAVRLPGDDDDRARAEHGRRRAVALRQERGEGRHAGVRGPRDPLAASARRCAGSEVAPAHLPHELELKAPPDAEEVGRLPSGPVDVDRDLGAGDSPSRVPARSQRTLDPDSSRSLTIRGGSNRESTTFTVTVREVGSRSTTIPSTTGVPSTSATRQVTIGGGTRRAGSRPAAGRRRARGRRRGGACGDHT